MTGVHDAMYPYSMKSLITIFLLLTTFDLKAQLSVTWMGVAGLYIDDGKDSFFIDPFVTRPSLFKLVSGQEFIPDEKRVDAWIKKINPKNVRAILISESHFDHILDAPLFVKKTNSVLMGSISTKNIGLGHGLKEEQVKVVPFGESITIGQFKITFMESLHTPIAFNYQVFSGEVSKPLKTPAKGSAYKMGGHYSYLIEHPNGNLVTHTTPVDDFTKRSLKNKKIDALFMAMATRKDTRKVLNRVVAPIAPKILYPIHWDNFFQKIDKFKNPRPSFIMQIPELLETAKKMDVSYPIVLPELAKKIIIN